MKKQALVKKDAGALEQKLPAYLTKSSGPARGMEEADQKDLTLPRMAICQSMTPQRKKTNPLFIQGLEEGQLFNTLTGKVYGTEVALIPIFMYKSRIKFTDFEDGGGIECQAINGKSGGALCPSGCDGCLHSQWGEKGDPPACTLFYNYPALIMPTKELVIVSMKSAGAKIARAWNTLIKLRNQDTFAGVYQVATVAETADSHEFYNFSVKNAGWADEETYKFAEQVYNGLKGKSIQMDTTGLETEAHGEKTAF